MLGIIDWGIGGLGVYLEVRRRWPSMSITYLSDTGATPYGRLSGRELTNRLRRVVTVLRERGVDHVMIACNAASTAIPDLAIDSVTISGVIEPAIAECISQKPTHIGVIGGRRTILSGVYRRAFDDAGIRVTQRIAQPLSAMIEAGDVASGELHATVRHIVRPLKNCSHLLMACTHYPAIADVISQYVSPQTLLIDPAVATASVISSWSPIDATGRNTFYTTGDVTAMRRSAKLAFDVEIASVTKVTIE